MRWNRRTRGFGATRAILVLLALAALAVLLAGCGGSSEPEVAQLDSQAASTAADTSSAETATTAQDARDLLVEFTGCVRDQGVNIPDPDFNASPVEVRKRLEKAGIDPEDPKFQDAIDACQPILLGILQTLSTEEIQGFRDSLLAYARCMRDEGVNLPDPDFTRGLDIFGGAIDPTDPAFDKADEKCGPILADAPNPFEGS